MSQVTDRGDRSQRPGEKQDNRENCPGHRRIDHYLQLQATFPLETGLSIQKTATFVPDFSSPDSPSPPASTVVYLPVLLE
jgi:hypothetical protein